MVQPEQKFREVQVTAKICSKEIEGKKGKFTSYNVEVVKNYTVEEGKEKTWKKTNNFFSNEIDNLLKVVTDAQKYLKDKKVKTGKENEE